MGRYIPWLILTLCVTALLLIPKLFQHAAGHTGDLDTGNYSHFAWSIAFGQPLIAVHGRHHFGEHFSPIMFLVAPVYWLWASAYVLMILQGLAVSAAILLTLRFAEQRLIDAGIGGERWIALATLLALFLLYPPLLATWRTQ